MGDTKAASTLPSFADASSRTLPVRQVASDSTEEKREDGERPSTRLSHFAACAPCRKRKLRCDGIEPICGTCSRASRQCQYTDVRKGVRKQRTSIKILEARLAELESRQHTSSPGELKDVSPRQTVEKDPFIEATEVERPEQVIDVEHHAATGLPSQNLPSLPDQPPLFHVPTGLAYLADSHNVGDSVHMFEGTASQHTFSTSGSNARSPSTDREGVMMGLGLEEPLPPREVQDDLNELYFAHVHRWLPAIHPARYLAGSSLPVASRLRPPHCLSYAMWALAAMMSESYIPFQELFYQRARKYADLDEMKHYGEHACTVAHAQTWTLIAVYEMTNLYLARGFLSGRKASALCISIGLNKLDGVGLTMSRLSSPAEDWIELEERRRTFWIVYVHDRYICSGTGWTPALDEQDIQTDLPIRDDHFANGIYSRGMKFSDAMTPAGARNVSTLASRAIMSTLLARILSHVHRADALDQPIDDMDNKFWKNYRHIENMLSNTATYFPESVAVTSSAAFEDPNIVFWNLYIQACTASLHQTAIFVSGKNPRLAKISSEAKLACMGAAWETVKIIKQVRDEVLLKTSPYTPFAVYCGARAFVLALRETSLGSQQSAAEVETLRESLRFLIAKLQLLRKTRPYTVTLLAQLDVDLESLGDLNPTGHITTVRPDEAMNSNSSHGTGSSLNTSPRPNTAHVRSNSFVDPAHPQAPSRPVTFTSRPSQGTAQYGVSDNFNFANRESGPNTAQTSSSNVEHSFFPNPIAALFSGAKGMSTRPVSIPMPMPTSMPRGDDFSWPTEGRTDGDQMFTLANSTTRAGSAPPSSIPSSMAMAADPIDLATLHMDMEIDMELEYGAYHSSGAAGIPRGLDFTAGAWPTAPSASSGGF